MPWCPNCKTEYREGFTHCSDCGVFLQDHPPQEPVPPVRVIHDRRALLLTAGDEMEAGTLIGLLENADIPAVKGYQKGGSYLRHNMGFTKFGVDIYVPESMLEQARRVIDQSGLLEQLPPEADILSPEEAEADAYFREELPYAKQNQRARAWIVVALSSGLAVAVYTVLGFALILGLLYRRFFM